MLKTALFVMALATPVSADVTGAVQDHALPGLARFAQATADLAALDSCDPAALQAGWATAFDAWLGVAHLRLGPVEEEGRVLAIAFWPDPKGIGARQTAALLAAADPATLTPGHIAEQSVAARGLFGMERLLFPATPLAGDYPCALTHALADDLARMAQETQAGWQQGFATALEKPGPGQRYLSDLEAKQALLTALVTGIEFNADARVARPLGSFDKPRPERAEARASGRSARNIALSLRALADFATHLAPAPKTAAALEQAAKQAEAVDFARLDDPQVWLKADILRQNIKAANDAAMAELAPALGVGVGFNAADGD
ncbi:MAG: imelysin family protein [Gemmobacter sp.]|uniref:imelysin family protein n=1 Tax=Gemmobacter sp. TaxID=1898957 RepID=UPI001A5F4E26|nr:imelysin family protein [Gemmobacter sp.]MBL8562689.1 imelysin family protein [Gemmobacter sp.]